MPDTIKMELVIEADAVVTHAEEIKEQE